MFIRRYSCGCIGFVLYADSLDDKQIICVKACDGDGHSPAISFHDRTASLRAKQSERLTHDEVADLVREIGALVEDGNALEGLRFAMKVAGL